MTCSEITPIPIIPEHPKLSTIKSTYTETTLFISWLRHESSTWITCVYSLLHHIVRHEGRSCVFDHHVRGCDQQRTRACEWFRSRCSRRRPKGNTIRSEKKKSQLGSTLKKKRTKKSRAVVFSFFCSFFFNVDARWLFFSIKWCFFFVDV
jgi:hypothetical protein